MLHASWNFIAKKYAGNYSVIYLSFLFSSVVTSVLAIPFIPTTTFSVHLSVLLITAGILHAVYGFVLTFAYKNGDISTLYPIVRGSGISGAVLLSLLVLREHLSIQSAFGVFTVISGIAILSYRRNRKATSPKGIFLAFLCGAFITCYTVMDKLLVADMHPMVVMAVSQVISAMLFLPYVLLKRKEELKMTLRTLLFPVILISIIATSSYLIILFVMQIAPLSRIVAVREASVVFGAIAGYLFLKEHFSRMRLLGVVFVMLGIILVKL